MKKPVKAEQCYNGIWVLGTSTVYSTETVPHVYKALLGSRRRFPLHQFDPSNQAPYTASVMRPFEAMCFSIDPLCHASGRASSGSRKSDSGQKAVAFFTIQWVTRFSDPTTK
jgi:hypothetical protein